MAKYRLVFAKEAASEFEALSAGQRKALNDALKLLEDDPCPAGSVELVGYAPLRRIKAGNARAIYDPPDIRNRIRILAVGSDHLVYARLADRSDR